MLERERIDVVLLDVHVAGQTGATCWTSCAPAIRRSASSLTGSADIRGCPRRGWTRVLLEAVRADELVDDRARCSRRSCRFDDVSVAAVRTPAEYEAELQRYLFERSEEGRAVRVGEKEISEQAAIVARYAGLFSREQVDALREQEDAQRFR